jgi:L-alanine-DL-glutamate epimerase-like enolase superfamily enzyme
MNRRAFLGSAAAAPLGLASLAAPPVRAAVAKSKITRVRVYQPPGLNTLFNQSNMVVTVETDAGITGVGEGGSKDTLEQCAGRLIGQDPHFIERLWQDMSRAFFYPPGREKLHALGALDLALWDIKGKTLGLPVHAVLGGLVRNHCECYNTSGIIPAIKPGMSIRERARATVEAGYRAFRMGAADTRGTSTFNTRERLNQVLKDCREARDGVGENGDYTIDFHQRFDLAEAIRGCTLIEETAPFFVEDPVRTEAFQQDLPILRRAVKVPLAAGEEWGNRWDFNKLVEDHAIDFLRATLPNVGGITEMMKAATICETHFVGIVPHFTGPIATAALVNCLGTYSGPVLMESNFEGRTYPQVPVCVDFKQGKLHPNDRPGLGVELDMKQLKQIAEITEPIRDRQIYYRPDGSITNW